MQQHLFRGLNGMDASGKASVQGVNQLSMPALQPKRHDHSPANEDACNPNGSASTKAQSLAGAVNARAILWLSIQLRLL